VSADDDSETATLVREVGCGLVVPPGRPDLVATAVRAAAAGEHDLDEMGARGRSWVEANADRTIAFARYRAELAETRLSTRPAQT
jgi:colanic acid biosynthesis glycosyl transferase WcaI